MGAVAQAFCDIICTTSKVVGVVCVEAVGDGKAEDG